MIGRLVRLCFGLVGGGLLGALLGFALALGVMAVDGSSALDGTYGMMEVLICLPSGALIGLLAGGVWAVRSGRPA